MVVFIIADATFMTTAPSISMYGTPKFSQNIPK